VSVAAGDTEAHVAHARPTKGLLVDVLTKDIDLIAAILDLVDNSVDAARQMAKAEEALEGFEVVLSIAGTKFELRDNCGGISLRDAKERAFRFGPDPDDPPDSYSTGQFGVGMKRALFKLGDAFEVRSRSAHDQFDLKVTVSKWLAEDDWDFPLRGVETGQARDETERGTTIIVKPLRRTIARELKRTTVVNELKTQVAQRHQRSIARGLQIKIGRTTLSPKEPEVVCDKGIVPLVTGKTLNGRGDPVRVKIVCGVSPGTQREAGWYVFLNDRAVLLADQTDITGWGESEEGAIPRFHPQYGRFRGFAFLSCEDTTRLPWNTTKTGLDADDQIYRRVRSMMVDAADPIVDFLDDLAKEEKQEGARFGDVGEALRGGKPVSIFELETGRSRSWKAPAVAYAGSRDPNLTRVYTDQDSQVVERAKRKTKASSNRALGDYLFRYFVKRELQ
jgi:hypothetical protein